MKILSFTLLIVIPLLTIYSQDTINVPADYSTIQAGIDACNNGDIVLVAEGTYYENIKYKGKAITVASHFLIDGDTSHISNTIIDGSQPSNPDSGSVVYFISGEDTTSILYGFTITGGSGTSGIYCRNSGAKILYNKIIDNGIGNCSAGGGIYAFIETGYYSIVIENNIISNNQVLSASSWWSRGGGIFILNDNGTLNGRICNNIISQNNCGSPSAVFAEGGGIWISNCSLLISNNFISGNLSDCHGGRMSYAFGGGVYLQASNSTFSYNIITDNESELGGGVYLSESSSVLSKNTISGNVALGACGLFLDHVSSILSDNIITNNKVLDGGDNGAICMLSVQSTLINNTIVKNSGGIRFIYSAPILLNNILWNDSTEIECNSPSHPSGLTIAYSNIQGGQSGIIAGLQDTIHWLDGNIDVYPEFIDTANGDYHLANNSPCIGAGIDSLEIAGVWYYCPLFDLEGNPRPNPVGTMPDMGAYESPLSVSGIEDYLSEVPNTYLLEQNFPNPFNSSSVIRYSVPQSSNVVIKVYDILGNEIEILVNEEKPVGTYEITWTAVNLPSGVYFYRLQAGDFIETKKMILLK